MIHLLAAPPAVAVAVAEPDGAWPLRPRPDVVRPFDPPDMAWSSGHRGVDLRGVPGQSVHAALAGTVSFVGRIAGVGVVVVDHGGTRTTYQPVEATVDVGTRVAQGTALGRLEWHGTHCLPTACLHWGLIRGDTYLDPLSLVSGPSPVRLLPLEVVHVMAPRSLLPPTVHRSFAVAGARPVAMTYGGGPVSRSAPSPVL